MQLSTPTASFDSSPLASLLAPGVAAPANIRSSDAPFSDFMPADQPNPAAVGFSSVVATGAEPTPSIEIDPLPGSGAACDLGLEFRDPATRQPLAGSEMTLRPNARGFAADRPMAEVEPVLVPMPRREPRSDASAAQPLQAREDSQLADGSPAERSPRHRAAAGPARSFRATEVKAPRSAETVPPADTMAPSPLSWVLEAGFNLSLVAPAEPAATCAMDSIHAEDASDFAGCPVDDRGPTRPFAPADDSSTEPNVTRENSAIGSAIGGTRAADFSPVGIPQASSGRVAVPRDSAPAENLPTMTTSAGQREIEPAPQILGKPALAVVTPAVGAAGRPLTQGSSVIPRVQTDAETSPVPIRAEAQPHASPAPADQHTATGTSIENTTVSQPMLRTRNVGLTVPSEFRQDSVSNKARPGVGGSITTALPTLTSMLPLKSAADPFAIAPGNGVAQAERNAAAATGSALELVSEFEGQQIGYLTLAEPPIKAPIRAVVENATVSQPMLRTRNFGITGSSEFQSDSTPLKSAARSGESIAAALPTMASMLSPKSASAPSVISPTSAVGQGEKTAGGSPDIAAAPISDFKSDQINFLETIEQQFKATSMELGIDVAKTPSAMPATTSNRRSTAPAAAASDSPAVPAPRGDGERLVPAAATPAFVAPPVAPAPVAPQPASHTDQPVAVPATPAQVSAAAHRAVDAVLASTDRFTPVTQSSVDLQLSVGDAPLSVRVEIRAGVVHATFRTDSPELRTALAQEWQAAGHQQSADQSLRLAPAVFASSDRASGDAGSALAGQNFSQGRDQSSRSAPEFFSAGSARSQLADAVTAEPAASPAPSRRSPADSSVRLHAFA